MTSSSVQNSSVTEDMEYTYSCLPCGSDGLRVKAVGYCLNCQEYLCQRCYDVHLIPTQTRRHRLLDGDQMLDIGVSHVNRKGCSTVCSVHKTKTVYYHCPTHAFFGCHFCFFKHQQTCRDVRCIPDVARNISSSSEFQEFKSKVTTVAQKCTNIICEVKSALQTTDECHTKSVTSVREFMKEVIDAMQKLEQSLVEKLSQINQEQKQKLSELAAEAKAVQSENQKIASQVEILLNSQQHCDLYTVMVKLRDRLLSMEAEMTTAQGGLQTRSFGFEPNRDVLETLKSPFGLGRIQELGTIEQFA